MSTITPGRLGGQYSISLVTDDIYLVQGLLHGKLHTIFKGEYEFATKLMDYCAQHDDEAQKAMHELYYEANPALITDLFDQARKDEKAKPRKRVEVWVKIATDVLESENAIQLVSSRVSQVAGMAGLVITQLEVHYAYPDEEFIPPPCDADGLVQGTPPVPPEDQRAAQLLDDSFTTKEPVKLVDDEPKLMSTKRIFRPDQPVATEGP